MISPFLNSLFQIHIANVSVNLLKYWCMILTIFIATSLMIGFYPAFFISRLNPLYILRGKGKVTGSKISIKKALICFQFAASIFLIIATIGVFRQIQFMNNKNTGFDLDNIMVVKSPMTLNDQIFTQNFHTFKNECMKISGIKNVTYTSCIPGIMTTRMLYHNAAKPETRDSYSFIEIDPGYFTTLKTNFITGRDFTDQESEKNNIIINEMAVHAFGFEDAESAIGGYISGDGLNRQIIGVVEDYHHLSPKNPITPYLYFVSTSRTKHFMFDINKKSYTQIMPIIQELYTRFFPGNPFDYSLLSEEYKTQYKNENRLSKMLLSFSLIAILIACMGLTGITMIESKLRIKEIGIRKVNGARFLELIKLMNLDFIKSVIIAFIFITPISWYFINRWLENFAFRTQFNWWIVGFAGLTSILITVITVSIQSWRAAIRNPVEALRYE